MSSNQNVIDAGSGSGLHKWVAILLALLLAVMWWLGYGPGGSKCDPAAREAAAPTAPTPAPIAAAPTAPPPTPAPLEKAPEPAAAAPATPPSPAPAAALTMKPEASVPAAKVYFGLDKTNLPGDVNKTLAAVVTYLKANADSKASISGFHDPSGNKDHNEELALNRARAVRAGLEKLGIPNDRVIMEKATETTGSGKPAEARRVEVTVVRPQ
jgi:K(+)-stimulated pyrophosphate-energized sodium pump